MSSGEKVRVGKKVRKRHFPLLSPAPGLGRKRSIFSSTGVPEASGDQGCDMPKAEASPWPIRYGEISRFQAIP